MHRTKIVMSSMAAAGLVLAGCSTGDDGDTTTTPQASQGSEGAASSAPAETSSDAAGGEDTEASGDLVAWAGDFCNAVAPLEEEFDGLNDATPDPSSTDDPFAGMAETFAQLGPAFAAAADAIEGVGAPPIDGGEEAFDAMVTTLNGAGDLYAGIEEQLAGLDPADPNYQSEIQAILAEVSTELEDSTLVIEEVFDRPEVTAAFEQAPECDGLDITG